VTKTISYLERLAETMDVHAPDCPVAICRQCRHIVAGVGNENADVMFIGEAPGREEDAQGRPFVGKSGKLLNSMLESIGLKRDDVYITNVVKARPPGNADPTPEEINHYMPWLDQEIGLVNPSVIVPLGLHAIKYFIPGVKVSEVHGVACSMNNKLIFPMYHPANALYDSSQRPVLSSDFRMLKMFLPR
jgi:DNA polymerase